MKRTRLKFSNEFKAKVVLEAIKEHKTLAEPSKLHQVHQNIIARWKREFLENAANAFESYGKDNEAGVKKSEKLYEKIGRLEVENDFLKKSLWKTGL
ncbi:MAG: transposase [Bacteroidetes bacterium]|jgi:transposase-like protein|nr:transposase [Bacteroidota bacterium]